METEDSTMIDNIQHSSKTGRPCGDEVFTEKIEKQIGRKLMVLPKGRPRNMK